MPSLNKVILVGVLIDEPVVREIREGEKVVGAMIGLLIETSRPWFDKKAGRRREGTEVHRVVVTEERLMAFAKTLTRGDEVYLEGELMTQFWRNELQEWQSLTQILLYRSNNQLSRFTEEDDGQVGMPSPHQVLRAFEHAEMDSRERPSSDFVEGLLQSERTYEFVPAQMAAR